MTANNLDFVTFVPDKVIGVSTGQKAPVHHPPQEHHSPNLENAMTVVDNLQEHSGIHIVGSLRRILEAIACFNLKGQPATNTDIHRCLKDMSYDAIRKMTRLLANSSSKRLVITLHERKGHEHQYVLANMQDVISTVGIHDRKVSHDSIAMENHNRMMTVAKVLQSLDNRPDPEFHHVFLKTELKDRGDYKRLRWSTSSDRNKGKVLERRLSLHRTYTATVYPSGTVTIMIGCSKQPFRWYCRDDWISLIGYCGSIHEVFRDSLSLSEPLIHTSESNWLVTQIHIGYDIPHSKIGDSKGSFVLSDFNNLLRVKDLDTIYQVYNKLLPYKGKCDRLEKQLNFSANTSSCTPTLSSLPETIIPPSPEVILNIVIPSSSPFVNSNNPLYYLRNLEQ
jgi:hypothetical protein